MILGILHVIWAFGCSLVAAVNTLDFQDRFVILLKMAFSGVADVRISVCSTLGRMKNGNESSSVYQEFRHSSRNGVAFVKRNRGDVSAI